MQTIQQALAGLPDVETLVQPRQTLSTSARETSDQRIARWISEAGMQDIPSFHAGAVKFFREHKKGLFVVGPSGCGKTTMLRILADRLKIPMVRARDIGRHVNSLCKRHDELHGFRMACNTEPHEFPGNRFEYDFVLDDLGKEVGETVTYGTRNDVVTEFVEERYDFWRDGRGCTSFTTELNYKMLRDKYPAHIMNRIEEMTDFVTMTELMRGRWVK